MERTIGPGHRDSLHLRRYNQKCYHSYMSIQCVLEFFESQKYQKKMGPK